MSNLTIKLPEPFSLRLVNQPESGMGYQIVDVILRNGKVLHRHKVLNAELLVLEENDHVQAKDIVKIKLVKI